MSNFSESSERLRKSAAEVRDSMTARTVFGDPVSSNGTTLIPAARVSGGFGAGLGGGEADDSEGAGLGMGYGLSARPMGAFVIEEDGRVRWKATLDLTRMFIVGCTVAIAYFFFARGRRAG